MLEYHFLHVYEQPFAKYFRFSPVFKNLKGQTVLLRLIVHCLFLPFSVKVNCGFMIWHCVFLLACFVICGCVFWFVEVPNMLLCLALHDTRTQCGSMQIHRSTKISVLALLAYLHQLPWNAIQARFVMLVEQSAKVQFCNFLSLFPWIWAKYPEDDQYWMMLIF